MDSTNHLKTVPSSDLLEKLLPEFRDGKENVMTLALSYVLEPLKDSFVKWIFGQVSQKPPEGVRLKRQAQMNCKGDSDAESRRIRPDTCFLDAQGEAPVLLIENKFSAGLTDGQPSEYIKKLAQDQPAVLVFVTPASRIGDLQLKCHKRCEHLGLVSAGVSYFSIGQKFVLFLSWEDLIVHLYQTAVNMDSFELKNNISQLEGIRTKMEGERIEPFTDDELRQIKQVARRLHELSCILEKLRKETRLSHLDPQISVFEMQTGISFDIQGKEFWLIADFESLAKEGDVSPFWLRIGFDRDWKRKPNKNISQKEQREIRLAMQRSGEPIRRIRDVAADTFALELPFASEQNEQEIIGGIVKVMLKLDNNLRDLRPASLQ